MMLLEYVPQEYQYYHESFLIKTDASAGNDLVIHNLYILYFQILYEKDLSLKWILKEK